MAREIELTTAVVFLMFGVSIVVNPGCRRFGGTAWILAGATVAYFSWP